MDQLTITRLSHPTEFGASRTALAVLSSTPGASGSKRRKRQ